MADTRFVTDRQTDGRTDGAILICHPKLIKSLQRDSLHISLHVIVHSMLYAKFVFFLQVTVLTKWRELM